MKKFNRYKPNCSEVGDLMSNEQGFKSVSPDDWNEFRRILDKGPETITDRQSQSLRDHVFRTVNSENPPLALTAKKHVYKHYAYARFGASQVSKGGKTPIQLDKGEVAEPDAIKLLSKIDGVEYQKNDKLFENKFFKGKPDVVLYENDKIIGVKEIKVPIDLISFFERLDGDHLPEDKWELLAYMDILGLKTGEICYVLVDMPKNVRDAKIKEAKDRYTALGYTPDHISRLVKNLEKSMTYDYIPEEKRVVRFNVTRQGYFTTQMHKRVRTIRERMTNLHEKFEKGLFLLETKESLPDSTD
jgi:hypothetical protein